MTTPATTLDSEGLVRRLRQTFGSGRTRPVEWRRGQLLAMHRMVEENEEELAGALLTDLGRPRTEAIAADLGHTKMELRHLAAHVTAWAKPRRERAPLAVLPARAEVRPEPLGVALVIAPWNYPFQLLLEPMAAAVAAGNCVVGKPSELAPACSAAVARLLPRYVDAEAIAVVEGAVPETRALLAERWDHVFFTGSTAVGRVVAEAAARNLTPTVLELGGKSPAYVSASADLDVASRRLAWGKFFNAGQTCVAPDYVLADRSVREALVARLAGRIAEFFGDDPRTSGSFGRIVNERHLDRLTGLLADGAGAVVAGGEADRSTRYLAPTITVDPDLSGPLMGEEIFGPILPVVAVDGPEEAVSFITSRPKPLALYVFAGDDAIVEQVLAGTSSGGVGVNHTLMQLVPPGLPFGGVGDSGHGAYHGRSGFDAFSHHRSILRKPARPDLKILYPPYGRTSERIYRWFLR